MILHWTKGRWVAVPHPAPNAPLYTVLALSAANVWFAGNRGLGSGAAVAEHWNGRRVSVVPSHLLGTIQQLSGTRADSVWALSWEGDGYTYLAHWNGSRWSQATGPSSAAYWMAISARSKADMWAVGENLAMGHGMVAHRNGAKWHRVRDPIFKTMKSTLSAVLNLGPRDVWAVGADMIAHYDGHKWKITPSPPSSGATEGGDLGVSGHRHGPLYVGGADRRYRGLILRWQRGKWVRVPVPLPAGSSSFDTLAVGMHGRVWAGGDRDVTSHHRVLHYRALIERYVPCSRP